MRVALVVPSARPAQLQAFLDAWEPVKFWTDLIVLEGDEVQPCRRVSPFHWGWSRIEEALGDRAWIVSRRDSARRSFGFYLAWQLGADLIVTLDDDTLPVAGQDFLGDHRRALELTPRWRSPVPGFVPRGLPYRDRSGPHVPVGLSVGLWQGVPDQDAIHQLATPIGGYVPPEGQWLLPLNQYFPLCGMNLAFPREMAPLMYFGLQGDPWPYARFDDIWGLLIAQKILRHLGLAISVGRPWVRHARASDPFANLIREAPGVARNESFWRDIDAITLHQRTPAACMAEVGAALEDQEDAYTATLGRALTTWAALFARAAPDRPGKDCAGIADSAIETRIPQSPSCIDP